VNQPLLPYALLTPAFPFRHLASLAGRAPIGGAREVALGCFVAARLAAERVTGVADEPDEGRAARSTAAKGWVGTLTLPAAVRGALIRCIESSVQGSAAAVGREVTSLASACASFLDGASRAELKHLADVLE